MSAHAPLCSSNQKPPGTPPQTPASGPRSVFRLSRGCCQSPSASGEKHVKNKHVRDEHVKDAAQDVGEDMTQDVADDVLDAAEDGLSSASGGTHAALALR